MVCLTRLYNLCCNELGEHYRALMLKPFWRCVEVFMVWGLRLKGFGVLLSLAAAGVCELEYPKP